MRIFKKILKVLAWIVGSLILLVFLLTLSLQLSVVQNFITGKAIAFLSKKTKTKIRLREISIAFPKSILIKGFYIEDQKKDTLLYTGYLKINIALTALINKNINIDKIDLHDVTAHINRTMPDSAFNFDFIIQAFSDSTKKQPADTAKNKWKFHLYALNIQKIYFTYNDQVSGIENTLKLGALETSLDKFDLDEKKFYADKIKLQNTFVTLTQSKQSTPDTSASGPLPDISLKKISVQNVHFKMHNKVDNMQMGTDVGDLQASVDKMNLAKQFVDIKSLKLDNSNFVMSSSGGKKTETKAVKESSTSNNWRVTLKEGELHSNNFIMSDPSKPELKGEMDYNHLTLLGIAANLKNVKYSPNSTVASVKNLTVKDGKQFILQKLSANILFDSVHTVVSNLDLRTRGTKISHHLEIHYKSLDDLSKNPGNTGLNIDLAKSVISAADLYYFAPQARKGLALTEKDKIVLTANIKGRIGDMNIKNLELEGLSALLVQAHGTIKGLPDPKNTRYNIDLEKLFVRREDLERLMPKGSVPNTINIPSTIAASGFFDGTLTTFNAGVDANTSSGKVNAKVSMQPVSSNEKRYSAILNAGTIDLGYILKDKNTYGTVSLEMKSAGTIKNDTSIFGSLNFTVTDAELKQYKYHQLVGDFEIADKLIRGEMNLKDPNIEFAYKGDINISKNNPLYKFTLELKGANFKALHFSDEDIRAKGSFVSDLTGSTLNDINGTAGIRDVLIIKNGKHYPVDSLLMASINKDKKTDIKIESSIFSAHFKGDLGLGDLSIALQQQFAGYFKMQGVEIDPKLKPQDFSFEIKLKEPDIFTDVLMPKLTKLEGGEVTGKYDSKAKKFDLNIDVKKIDYTGITIDNLTGFINADDQSLKYGIQWKNLSDSANFSIKNTSISGTIKDSVSINFAVKDDKGTEKIFIGGIINTFEKAYQFRLTPKLILNGSPWTVDNQNKMVFGNKQMEFKNVNISHDKGQLSLISDEGEGKPPFKIEFKEFQISSLSEAIQKSDKPLVGGLVNGMVRFEHLDQSPAFVSDLTIKDFAFKGDSLGNLTLKADNREANTYSLDLKLLGHGNEITAKGKYKSGESNSSMNFDVELVNVELISFRGLSQGQVEQMAGQLVGKLNVSGTTDAPKIIGDLHFEHAFLRPTYTGSLIKIEDSKIQFTNKGIEFNNFTIADTLHNKGVLNGTVQTTNYKDFDFNLNFKASDFLIINTHPHAKALYYGHIYLDSDLSIKGTPNLPVIRGKVGMDKKSELVYVRPDDDESNVESDGIVMFVDSAKTMNPILVTALDSTTKKTSIKGLDLNMDISLNKDAKIKVVVDQQAGDSLLVQGTSELNFTLDPNGTMNMSGDFKIDKGNYQLTMGRLLKRKFEIDKGSSITWNGSATDALVDITAIYKIKASAIDLVQDQISGASEQEKNMYKQKLPFLVYLKIKGEMLKPEITFDIQLPDEEKGALGGSVTAKLDQIREEGTALDKQVFALLLMGRFIGDDPFASAASGGGVSGTARNSVSQALSQQLNSLTSNVKGVDVNMNVESYDDYSSGSSQGRTKLNVGVSKQLLNDRFTVQVGGAVDLEGEKARENAISNIAGDMTIEYKLTPDARYRLKGYRKHTYEGVIEGELIQTGFGIVFIRDYNKAKDLFKKPKHLQEKKENDL